MDIRTEISPSEVMKKEASTNAEAAQSAGTSENARESACRELGSRILYTCRSEVCARFPFFSPGIAALSCEVISREKSRRTDLQEIHGIGTDRSTETGISAYSVSLPVPSPLFPGKSKETVVEPCLRSGSRAFVKGKYTGRSVGIFCRRKEATWPGFGIFWRKAFICGGIVPSA